MAVREEPSQSIGTCAAIFNSAIAAAAISAASELGVIDEIEQSGHLDISAFVDDRSLHGESIRAMLVALASFEIVELDDAREKVQPGPGFAEVHRLQGFFYWLVRGYGHLLTNLPDSTRNAARSGDFYHRDVRAVSLASAQMSAVSVDPLFLSIIEPLTFTATADLGCGSARRLIQMIADRPAVRGVGVDIAPAALAVARESVAAAGLTGSIGLVEASVTDLTPRPEFADVELVTCFFLGHDFWPRARCVNALRGVRQAFPHVEHFLLCDTYRSSTVPSAADQIFTLGFELTHAVMGQYLPSLAEWRDVFEESGWSSAGEHPVEVPPSTAIFHLRPR
jgi:hypothetical protein